MKHDPKDKDMFLSLKGSRVGRQLTDYVERLIADCVDIRNLDEITESDVKGRKVAASIIEEYLLGKIRSASAGKDVDVNEYE